MLTDAPVPNFRIADNTDTTPSMSDSPCYRLMRIEVADNATSQEVVNGSQADKLRFNLHEQF